MQTPCKEGGHTCSWALTLRVGMTTAGLTRRACGRGGRAMYCHVLVAAHTPCPSPQPLQTLQPQIFKQHLTYACTCGCASCDVYCKADPWLLAWTLSLRLADRVSPATVPAFIVFHLLQTSQARLERRCVQNCLMQCSMHALQKRRICEGAVTLQFVCLCSAHVCGVCTK